MKPHKHAEVIKAWADGAEIQNKYRSNIWHDTNTPKWHNDIEYRVKPEPKPDVVRYLSVCKNSGYEESQGVSHRNLIVTFDGETGKLKSAEVLK